jgi:phage tail-like protein
MPYDYPGEYAVKWDGVDVGRFRDLVATTASGLRRPAGASLERSGPGTLELRDVAGVSIYGDVLLHRWPSSTTAAGGPPRNLTIEVLDASGAAVTRWHIRNARPMKWVVKPAGIRTASRSTDKNDIAVETLTIVHEGIIPTD